MSSKNISNYVNEIRRNNDDKLSDFEENFLLVCAFVSMSNLYRRMSEKLIDECFNNSIGGN